MEGRRRAGERVCVVVLGDLGRSPRMQYHVKSLLANEYAVDVIAYHESEILPEISMNQAAYIYKLMPFPLNIEFPGALKYLFKMLWITITLLIALISIRQPKYLICQNPPGVPTLFVCYAYCLFTRAKFIIDWHNYTYSILELSLLPSSFVVKIAKFIESFFGRRSAANFCVTKAMKTDLMKNWGIDATVLYDRPPSHFGPITLKMKHEFYMSMSKKFANFLPKNCEDFKESGVCESTVFTQRHTNGDIVLKNNRPGLLVSSTSWTADEDFGILLRALEDYEKEATNDDQYPNLICVITGKGPEKDLYLEIIKKKRFKRVAILTPWLTVEDYPRLLASADLGVCLHYSSSGVDLPMKVVDMFGCGLPVCAINYQCISELVKHKCNGFVFENSTELSGLIKEWFYNHPNNATTSNMRSSFESSLSDFQELGWDENWNTNALRIFQ